MVVTHTRAQPLLDLETACLSNWLVVLAYCGASTALNDVCGGSLTMWIVFFRWIKKGVIPGLSSQLFMNFTYVNC